MKSNISKALRNIIYERDSYTCILCERGGTDLHHVLPLGRGGRNNVYNIVSLCREHHMAIHGEMNLTAEEREELNLRVLEYISDLYAEDFYKFSGLRLNPYQK